MLVFGATPQPEGSQLCEEAYQREPSRYCSLF
uniref:Uncharacterized protein n=1 Tax=Arundo donax TaxID=35708 RepID=A0A0A9FEE0_ARUDO